MLNSSQQLAASFSLALQRRRSLAEASWLLAAMTIGAAAWWFKGGGWLAHLLFGVGAGGLCGNQLAQQLLTRQARDIRAALLAGGEDLMPGPSPGARAFISCSLSAWPDDVRNVDGDI